MHDNDCCREELDHPHEQGIRFARIGVNTFEKMPRTSRAASSPTAPEVILSAFFCHILRRIPISADLVGGLPSWRMRVHCKTCLHCRRGSRSLGR